MEQTKLVPKRRFKEFQNTSAWEQRKLGEMGDTFTGLSGKTKEDFGHGDAKFVTYINVFSNPISDPYGTESVEIDSKQKEVKYGDVFFTTSSETPEEVGMSSVWLENTENVYLNSFCFGYRPTVEFDPYYLAFMLRSPVVRKKFMFLAQGISRYNISKNKVMDMLVSVPTLEEQKKVGAFYKELENLITLHQRKLEKMKALKFAYLSEMFPAEGERLPKRRFAGFTQAWEQRKLKDFGKATGGTSIESEFVDGGKYKVISIGSYSEQSVYTDQNIRAELTDKTKNRILNKDDLTMILNDKTASGNIIGRVLLIDSNDSYVYNQRTERIEPDHEKYNSQFLYQLLNAPMIRSRIIKQAQGNTQIYVNWSAISELDYLVPNLDEQREIGAFFSNFDHLITLHQRKLEKLQNIKKAYLNEMFV
ncbi:restriction endonuclease subunit S [Heyndrickxia faecalis]|jgi:type I restriction enzyme S subunit|uniref:restriction endonuclease subunit S n=1 Tax=Heyndrickxia faecalis TaxID=2824910 RepID=UPI003100EEFB